MITKWHKFLLDTDKAKLVNYKDDDVFTFLKTICWLLYLFIFIFVSGKNQLRTEMVIDVSNKGIVNNFVQGS